MNHVQSVYISDIHLQAMIYILYNDTMNSINTSTCKKSADKFIPKTVTFPFETDLNYTEMSDTGLGYLVEFVVKPHDYCYRNSILGGG